MSTEDVALVQAAEDAGQAEVDAPEDADLGPVLNAWYWTKPVKEKGKKRDPAKLGCATHIGSNYVRISFPGKYHPRTRVHLDDFAERCQRELAPEAYITRQIGRYRDRVRELMGEVRDLTQRLGVGDTTALPAGAGETAALSTVGADLGAYKTALIAAKEKTLPDLFKSIEAANEMMAKWMMAESLPMRTETEKLEKSIKVIDTRVGNVELYAGLTEKVEQLSDGEPAPIDTPIHLFQRRHYMDEECLAAYEAGGMDYKSVSEFGAWIAKPTNRNRILPHPRCVVAFRIRHHEKERHAKSLRGFIEIMAEAQADKATFLFIRNGDRVYMIETAIDFDERLFPDLDAQKLHGKLWVRNPEHTSSIGEIITDDQYQGLIEEHAAWKAKPKAERRKAPWDAPDDPHGRYIEYDHRTVYFDDIEAKIQADMAKHNRLVMVLQGLLDRSLVLHPHPPYKLWTAEGFQAALRPVYDHERAITSGDAPEWEVYRSQLAKSIRVGTVVMGQHRAWGEHEAAKENDRRDRNWRSREKSDLETYEPYGNPGPGLFARVVSMSRDRTKATFEWQRRRQHPEWVPNPERPGWLKASYERLIPCRFTCPVDRLFNVDAYEVGGFHLFFDDPRTREKYLEWAPFLLAAEDYKAGKRRIGSDDAPETEPTDPADDADAEEDAGD